MSVRVDAATGFVPREPVIPDETVAARIRRLALGCAWSAKHNGPLDAGRLLALHARGLFAPTKGCPGREARPFGSQGIAGVAYDLSVASLCDAYATGYYPFSHVLAPKWLSPPERCVVAPRDFHISKRMRSHVRKANWSVTFDAAFADVMRGCAEPRPGQSRLTWITPRIMRAFQALHEARHAHSFEVWDENDALIGGGYGVAARSCFTIESQFFRVPNASKVGFAFLMWHLARWGFELADNKQRTEAVTRYGFADITRDRFQRMLAAAPAEPLRPGRWRVEADAATVADWRPGAGDA